MKRFGMITWLAALSLSLLASLVQAGPARGVAGPGAPAPLYSPSGWVDIAFVGYCDGMHLNNIDGDYIGFRTGCGDGAISGDDLQEGLGLSADLLTSTGVASPLRRYVLLPDKSFEVYSIHGDLINSGVWEYTKPTPGAKASGSWMGGEP